MEPSTPDPIGWDEAPSEAILTFERIEYFPAEGNVRPVWSVDITTEDEYGDYRETLPDVRVETIANGTVIDETYAGPPRPASTDKVAPYNAYPFDGVDIDVTSIGNGDPITIRAAFGSGLSDLAFTDDSGFQTLEATGTANLPDVMRTDFDFSSTAQLTYSYSVPGEFINRTDWNIEATNVSYNFDTEEATIELKGWYDNPEGYVEGRFMWRTGVNGTMVHEIEESAGGKPKLMNWGNFDGTEDRSELIVPAEPGDVITIALYEYNDYDDEEEEETGLKGSFEIDGDPTDMLVLLVPQDTREADVELIDCAYNADTVVAGSTARMFVTLENTQKMDTLADLTFGSGRNAGTVEGIELAPYEVRNVEVEITPEVTGEYDFTPSIDAYRPDDPRR